MVMSSTTRDPAESAGVNPAVVAGGGSEEPTGEGAGGAAEDSADGGAQAPIQIHHPNRKWYVVHTYSGYETRAKRNLEERVRQQGLQDAFGAIVIPTENVQETVRGAKRVTKRKFFPGYMLVHMELNEHTWHCVKGTPKVTGFVGGATQPAAVPESEVERLTSEMQKGTLSAKPRIEFEAGENVRVIDGPFANFNGTVEDVRPEKSKVRVLVSIFGRSTPVELDFGQVEKVG
jgi:transcription termination/antitermination protein NusG